MLPITEERMGFYCSSRAEIAEQGWALVGKLGVGAFPPEQDGYAPYFKKLFKPFGPNWKPDLLSESYEALRALAEGGSMVAVLSSRVAAVARGDLIELKNPFFSDSRIENKDLPGSYKISLVSDRSLGDSHSEYLARELKLIMQT